MKILFISSLNIFKVTSADANRWRSLIEGLVSNEIEVHMVITHGFQSLSEFRELGFSGKIEGVYYYYSYFYIESNVWLKRISFYLISPYIAPLFNRNKIRQVVKRINPDLVFLHPSYEALFAFRFSFIKKCSFKLMIELNEFYDVTIDYSTNKLQRYRSELYNKLLEKRILPIVDFCLVMTQSLLIHYKKIANNPNITFFHLPMTVDLTRFSNKNENLIKIVEPYIAYCGTSSFRKDGVDILIKSFINVSSKFPDLKLKIAAFWSHDGDKMLQMIEDCNLNERIEYLGVLDREAIPEFLINAKLLVLPRPDSRQAKGGFPTKLGEYLATGNPVCVTRVGEISNYLEDEVSAFIAEPGDIESFTNAMLRALSNPLLANLVGANGLKIAEENFSMKVQSKRLVGFLNINLRS